MKGYIKSVALIMVSVLILASCSNTNGLQETETYETEISEVSVSESTEETTNAETDSLETSETEGASSSSPTPTPTTTVLDKSLEDVVETLSQALTDAGLEFEGIQINYADLSTAEPDNYDLGYNRTATITALDTIDGVHRTRYTIMVYELEVNSSVYNEYYSDGTLTHIYAYPDMDPFEANLEHAAVNGQYVLEMYYWETGDGVPQWPNSAELEPVYNAFVEMN